MYGQLKSTVTCLTCSNISITFDPFVTLSLPIARPVRVEVIFVPYELFIVAPNSVKRNPCKGFKITLKKGTNISDLLEEVNKGLEGKVAVENMLAVNFNERYSIIESILSPSSSCMDIDTNRDTILIYELKS